MNTQKTETKRATARDCVRRFVSVCFKYLHLWRWEKHEKDSAAYRKCGMEQEERNSQAAAEFHWKAAEYFAGQHLQRVHPNSFTYTGMFNR